MGAIDLKAHWRSVLAWSALAASLVAALACALIGIDFGVHWDEPRLINAAADSVASGFLLPGWYNYPSLSYDLLILLSVPDISAHVPGITDQLRLADSVPATLVAASGELREPAFLLRARILFAIITLASAIWAFGIVRVLRRPALEAALAAALLLSMWEVGYHARWIAPDGLMMFMATLTALLVVTAIKSTNRGILWLHAAAATTGLAIGSKYPAGILLIPLACAGFMLVRARNPGLRPLQLAAKLAPLALTCGATLVVAFAVTTPALVVAPWFFIQDVLREMWHYARQGHHGNSIQPGLEHGGAMLQYLGFELFSPWAALSAVFFLTAVAGAVDFIRKDRALAICLLAGPAIYLLYFASQKVMFVRNLMIVFPIFAILAARGISWGLAVLAQPRLRHALAGLVVLATGANFGWQAWAALSIHARDEGALAEEADAYLRQRSNEKFALLDGIGSSHPRALPANVVSDPTQADVLIINSAAHPEYEKWTNGNRPGTYTVVAGGLDVNWDYYPAWIGRPHYVAVSREQGQKMGLMPAAR